MDNLILKAGELLISQGPFCVVVAVMIWRDFRRDKRLDFITEQHMNLSNDLIGVLSIVKERLK